MAQYVWTNITSNSLTSASYAWLIANGNREKGGGRKKRGGREEGRERLREREKGREKGSREREREAGAR